MDTRADYLRSVWRSTLVLSAVSCYLMWGEYDWKRARLHVGFSDTGANRTQQSPSSLNGTLSLRQFVQTSGRNITVESHMGMEVPL
jgi:hypothetical protein